MKLKAPRRLRAACAAALVAALWLAAFTQTNARAEFGRGVQTPANDEPAAAADLNLRDFGAAGDGSTDDGPALQSALDALAAAGGGTLTVPAGRYAISTPVHKDFGGLAAPVTIQGVPSNYVVNPHHPQATELARGLGLASEFLPRTARRGAALSLAGLQTLVVKDLAFVGTPNVTTDAIITVGIDRVESATVRHCEFYGLATMFEGGAIVRAARSGLHVVQTKFLGSTGNSGVYTPVIDNLTWKSVALTDVIFLDYGLRPELFSKTGYGAPYSWMNIGNAAAVTPDSPRREVTVNRAFLDEGGFVGLSSLPTRYQPPTAPIDLYYITGLRMNVSNLQTTGHYLYGLRGVLVEDSRYGWTRNADSAIHILSTGHAIIDRIHTEAHATRLRADAATNRFTVINSVYEEIASLAKTTRVVNTEADEDDPVWYVRARFNAALGRVPDPAAHFYWAEQLLLCADGDAACVAGKRADLEAYLASAPPPVFDLSGRVTDETGAGVEGASVALKGSQNVTGLTDAAGLYRFRGLPTSGAYTVTAAKRFHTFANPTQSFTTPGGDRAADFSGAVSRHAISGRLLDNAGQPLAAASVALTGTRGGATTTDAGGNYSFAGLPDGGSYTVAPSRLGHSFSPAARTVAELAANVTADFTGTPGAHAISGRVTAGGSGLAGVTVTLSGSRGATTNTDADGNYSFAGLPAGGSYSVTPAKVRFGLAPSVRSFANLGASQTADFTALAFVNHALESGGAVAAASSTLDAGRSPRALINGDRRGLHWGSDPATGSGWHDATRGAFPDWVEITFPGLRTIQEVSVFGVQDNFRTPQEPSESTPFTLYGVTGFQAQYWTGSEWQAVPGGLVVSNDRVWRRLTFAPLTTTQIRVLINSAADGHSRLAEVEAWGPPAPPAINYALASAGATATASSTLDAGRSAAAVINGDRRGIHWGTAPATGSGWHDATANAFPDWVEVNFGEAKTISVVNVFGVQDDFRAPVTPTTQTPSTLYALVDFQAQYWNGSGWVTLPNGNVTDNDRVWRRITFPAVSTAKVRVLVTKATNRHSRVVELEAWGEPPPTVNVAAAANGATATASSTLDAARGPEGAIDGDRRGTNWGAGGGWHDATPNAFPDWLQINFDGAKTVGEVSVFTLQDNPSAPSEPTAQMTFSQYGVTGLHVEYWTGSAWAAVAGASASNSLVWKKITFSPVTTDKLRVVVDSALAGHSRITEIEAY